MLRTGSVPRSAPVIRSAARKRAIIASNRRDRAIANLQLEQLETRDVPSLAGVVAAPTIDLALQATPKDNIGGFIVYSPAEIRAAYGFNQVSYTGAGQTIAIIDAYDDPKLASDLSVFDSSFGLPGQNIAGVNSFLTKVNEYGGTSLPQANSTWAVEITLDVEWAHAIAPGAHILLVEASSANAYDLLTAVNTARYTAGVSEVSMSWGSAEFSSEAYYDSLFTTPATHIGGNGTAGGITFVASSGDNGAWYGPEWPSVSPNVLAVGGTSLAMNGYAYAGEAGWSGSGGGYSAYESRPSYQATANTVPVRSTPDVAYDGNPGTGYYLYTTYAPGGESGWFRAGGTSAGAPQWAALLAMANQERAQAGLPSLYSAQSAIYSLPASDFHGVTTGYNGYTAHAGYNPVTGLGSPRANLVINALLSVQNSAIAGSALSSKTGAPGQVGGNLLIASLDATGESSGSASSPVRTDSSGSWTESLRAAVGEGQGLVLYALPTAASSATVARHPDIGLLQAGPFEFQSAPAPFLTSGESMADPWSDWIGSDQDTGQEGEAE